MSFLQILSSINYHLKTYLFTLNSGLILLQSAWENSIVSDLIHSRYKKIYSILLPRIFTNNQINKIWLQFLPLVRKCVEISISSWKGSIKATESINGNHHSQFLTQYFNPCDITNAKTWKEGLILLPIPFNPSLSETKEYDLKKVDINLSLQVT